MDMALPLGALSLPLPWPRQSFAALTSLGRVETTARAHTLMAGSVNLGGVTFAETLQGVVSGFGTATNRSCRSG